MKNKETLIFLVVLLHCLSTNNGFAPSYYKPFMSPKIDIVQANAFTRTRTPARRRSLHSTKSDLKEEKVDEPQLSELDARVLKTMLKEDKLELDEEQNMKKLLERGVAPKTPDKPPTRADMQDDDGEYSSTLFKTLSSERFWNSVKSKAGEVLESVSIFVANRVERDAKLLAAVGLFAWERAKRDVARALPESGTSGAAVGRAMRKAARQLSNTSSYEEQQSMDNLNLYEELNTPMDEIRSVTQSIVDILSEKDYLNPGRGLRTVAPAGQASSAERQRRAYARRKASTLKREKEGLDQKLGRAAVGVADAAWELKREMQVETNKPGYRTEGARKAIQAGAERTAKVLQAATEEPGGWKRVLFGSLKKDKETVLEIGAAASVPVMDDLLQERQRIVASLRECLEAPEETWLVAEVLSGCVSDDDGCPVEIDDDALREVVTSMICLRDDLEAGLEEELDTEQLLAELKSVKGSIESISALATEAAGYKAGESLNSVLYGQEQEPMLLRLDEIEVPTVAEPDDATYVEPQVEIPTVEVTVTEPTSEAVKPNMWFAKEEPSNGHDQHMDTVEVMDATPMKTVDAVVIPEIVSTDAVVVEHVNGDTAYQPEVQTQNVEFLEVDKKVGINGEAVVGETEFLRSPMVEVVSDEDFEEAFGSAKSTAVLSEEELEAEENQDKDDNILVQITLRSLDAVVFVAEKLLTVGVPGIFKLGKTAYSRLAHVNRDGLGYKGWKKHRNVQDGKKRY